MALVCLLFNIRYIAKLHQILSTEGAKESGYVAMVPIVSEITLCRG